MWYAKPTKCAILLLLLQRCKETKKQFSMGETYKTSKFGLSSADNREGEFERKSFEEGSSRFAFMGEVTIDGQELTEMSVLKMFKTTKFNTLKKWTCDIKACERALSFSADFDKSTVKIRGGNSKLKSIEFVQPECAVLNDYDLVNPGCFPCKTEHKEDFVVIVEKYLTGSYIKFSDNSGYEKNDANADILFAFSHWTYENSENTCMVCDLQGIEMENKYVLTDPSIHSINQEYGITDLGLSGIQSVFNGHICNDICVSLGLGKFQKRATCSSICESLCPRLFKNRNAIHPVDPTNNLRTLLQKNNGVPLPSIKGSQLSASGINLTISNLNIDQHT